MPDKREGRAVNLRKRSGKVIACIAVFGLAGGLAGVTERALIVHLPNRRIKSVQIEPEPPTPEKAWAVFLLNESFIPPLTRGKVNLAISAVMAFRDKTSDGVVQWPVEVGFRPVSLDKVINVLGKQEKVQDRGENEWFIWGGLVLDRKKGTNEFQSFGFTKKMAVMLTKNGGDYFEQAKRILGQRLNGDGET